MEGQKFGPVLPRELHNTTQAMDAGLPNDGMLFYITQCRQAGFATPKSLVSLELGEANESSYAATDCGPYSIASWAINWPDPDQHYFVVA